MSKVDEDASAIRAKAKELGLNVSAHGQVVIVSGRFAPGDKSAYIKMEDDANTILRMFRQVRAGSVWGSDSGSVGGAIALESGNFTLKKSGVAARLAAKFA